MKIRCKWAGTDPIYVKYHDTEWGVPLHDDRKLFEFLMLDGFQAGLSWITILKKRPNYRKAFDHFDPEKIADYNLRKLKALLSDKGIVRNKLKIEAAVQNAGAFRRGAAFKDRGLQGDNGRQCARVGGPWTGSLQLQTERGVGGSCPGESAIAD